MVKKHNPVVIAPPAPRLLANDLPPDRDPSEAQKDTLWDFTDAGAQIWKEPQDEASQLTSNLKRLWVERGDFSQLTIESIEKQKSKPAIDSDLPTNNNKGEATTTGSEEESKPSETITVDELWEMRVQMTNQLLVMSGELSTGLDLLNTLLAPLAPEAVDSSSLPLPPGGIAPMTHSLDHLSPQPESITLINSSVSLMRKRNATHNASHLLQRAAGELAREAKRSHNEWDTLLTLREAGWNMRPKGAKPGADMSLMGRGAERAAKQIGIAYATTEAAEALRASSFASLEPLEPENHDSTQISLKLPPRPRRRLAITLTLPNQTIERFSPWERYHNLKEMEPLPFAEDLELARAEVLEEEIFGEISKDAQSSATYRTSTSDRSVVVKGFWEDAEISFEMLERDEEAPQMTGEGTGKCRLISALMRLLMISIYRTRRSYAIGITSASPAPTQPKILEPVLDLLVFSIYTRNVRKLILQAVSDLSTTQLEVEAEIDPVLESASEVISMLCERRISNPAKLDVGGVAALRIMGRRSITFSITCPVVISYWMKDEPLRIGPDQLYSVFMNAINQSMIDLVMDMVDSQEGIRAKRAPTGVLYQSDDRQIFLTPKFRLGAGLTIQAESLAPTTSNNNMIMMAMVMDDKPLERKDQEASSSPANYLGQTGITHWLHSVIFPCLLPPAPG